MSAAWWGREATSGDSPLLTSDGTPILFDGDHRTVSADVRARVPAFAPTWTRRSDDAGEALVRLFGEQVEAVLTRLGRWPDKALVEYLITAGVEQRSATPATALLTFTIAPSATQSVLVPAGFQVGAQPPGGGGLVTFETDRDLVAAPVNMAALLVQEGALFTPVPTDSPPPTFLPFGDTAENGCALWIGLDGDAMLGPQLALGFSVWASPGAPPPVSAGGVMTLPLPPSPLLAWHLLDGTTLVPVQVLRDDTAGLQRTGAVELQLARSWAAGVPSGFADGSVLRWLRLSIAAGRFDAAPQLISLSLNSVPATAAVTVREEVLEVASTDGRSYRVTQTPVLRRSLILAVDEGDDLGQGLGGAGDASGAPDSGTVWQEVDDLSQFGPTDRVYSVDCALGIVYVGDGVHGAAVPPGYRNVVARQYRVGGGAAGAVDAGQITSLLSAAPFVTAATNTRPASGGDDPEPTASAIRRGPEEVRARGRAVTLADYELFVPETPETDARRAHALSGHPAYPGAFLPGVVGVIVVPADRGEGPPIPDSQTLAAVAQYLSGAVAPLGVEVVAAAPEYHRVAIQARVLLDPAADVGPTVERVLAALDAYLHPLTGGDDGTGWPFGGAVRHADMVRQIVAVDGVRAAPRVDLIVDGELAPDCADVAIGAYALVWPDPHQVIPVDSAENA